MLALHGFRLYNTETFFSTHPNVLSYGSAVTPHSSEISDCVTLDRSLIFSIWAFFNNHSQITGLQGRAFL